MIARKIVTVSGSLRADSTTTTLLTAVGDALIDSGLDAERETIELGPLARDIAERLIGPGDEAHASPGLDRALRLVGEADMLIVGTPVYKGSYTGLFKSFFDLLAPEALRGIPVMLCAGGGNDEHRLMIDHQLRPLFAFFGALVLPASVYSRAKDYSQGQIASADLRTRIDEAVRATLPVLMRLGN